MKLYFELYCTLSNIQFLYKSAKNCYIFSLNGKNSTIITKNKNEGKERPYQKTK